MAKTSMEEEANRMRQQLAAEAEAIRAQLAEAVRERDRLAKVRGTSERAS
jgi:hypothetical protein